MLKELFTTISLSSAISFSPTSSLPLRDMVGLDGLNTYYIGEVDLDFVRVDYLPCVLNAYVGSGEYDGNDYVGVMRFVTRFKTRCKVGIDTSTVEYSYPTMYYHFMDMEAYFYAHFTGYLDNGNFNTVVDINNVVDSTFILNSNLMPSFINRYHTLTGNDYVSNTFVSSDTLEDLFSVNISQYYDGYSLTVDFMGISKWMNENNFYNGHFDEDLNDTYYFNLFSLTNNNMERNPYPYIVENFKEYYYGVMSGDGSAETYNRGYNNGYNDGYNSAYSIGYSVGLQDGYEADGTAMTIFSGVLAVGMLPINVFLSIFNFEILGINLSAFVSSLLSVCIVLIVIKRTMAIKED